MISKLRFSLIAVILLVLLGFGFQNQANGQAGENAQFCPFVEVSDGWLKIDDITPLSPFVNFTGGLIGTVEGVDGNVVGGMDWMHVDFTNFFQPTPTNEDGAQIVTWWTQKGGRNTYVQLTNDAPDFTWVHARLLDENCVEIRNFCDFYTPFDTHVYDFGDLITNEGDTPDDNVLQGHEGFLTITAVDECPSPDRAVDYNFLAATVQILDELDYAYGFNAYHRYGICFDEDVPVDINLVLNGSFQDGVLGPWSIEQGASQNAGVITSSGISPSIPVPPCQGPDCSDPDADLFQAFVASDDNFPSGYYGQGFGPNTILGSLMDQTFINTAVNETNVTVVQSNFFSPGNSPNFVSNTGVVEYDLRYLAANDLLFNCNNYAAVCLINVTQFVNGTLLPVASLVDCDCYNRNGAGTLTGVACADVGDDNVSYAIQSHEFQGGASSLLSGLLNNVSFGNTYVVQLITGQFTNPGCFNDGFPRADVGALVDNVRNVETFLEFIECDGILTGAFNAFLTSFNPTQLAGQFNVIDDNEAAGDAIMINFADEYLPEYRTLAAFVSAEIGIFDDGEEFQSCGDLEVCFIRLGIDADIPTSEEFNTPTPTGGPVTPTPTVTIGPPTPTPTSTNTGGGGGSCAVAVSPVQLGTAFANVLIPLVPIAFAFGVRAVRRRKK
jgi:hypothetical protein